MVSTKDGGYALRTVTSYVSAFDPIYAGVIKLDSMGNKQWEYHFILGLDTRSDFLLETNDKAFIYIPNGELANHKIINLSRSGAYRLNIPLGVSYNANLEQTRQVLINVMLQNPLVLQTPEPKLVVSALGDSSVNLLMRP